MAETLRAMQDRRTGVWEVVGNGAIFNAFASMFNRQPAVAPSRIVMGEQIFSVTTCTVWEPSKTHPLHEDPAPGQWCQCSDCIMLRYI